MGSVKVVKKVWGEERWLINTPDYCGKVMKLMEGYRCSLHQHLIKDETFYVVSGYVLIEHSVDASALESKILSPGEHIRIVPTEWHRFTGLTDAEIVEISTHHEDSDSVRATRSGRVPDEEWHKL